MSENTLSLALPWMKKIESNLSLPLIKKILFQKLSKIHKGSFTIREGKNTYQFSGKKTHESQDVIFNILNSQVYYRVLMGGSLGAGEAYIKGQYQVNDLVAMFRLFLQNINTLSALENGLGKITTPIQKTIHWLRYNSKNKSRENIQAHYDLGNNFFKLFLDETLSYSCGIFEKAKSSLKEASLAKIDRACQKLRLKSSDHLLEIGSGWGALAIHAAQQYGCRVTTTTLSEKQYLYVKKLIKKLGLEKKITLIKKDYRDLQGKFDKIVSIEMIEAIGYQFYETFFKSCEDLLKPKGMMLLQSILIADPYFDLSKDEVDFNKKYIFPGSCIPSLGALSKAITQKTSLQIAHLEDLTPHYVKTLREWRRRFLAQRTEVKKQAFSDEFIRMWEYYLAYSEAGFAERYTLDMQMLLVMPEYRG